MAMVLNRLMRDETIIHSATLSVLLMMIFLMVWQVHNPIIAEEASAPVAEW